jgi:hypothetical protein
MLAAFANTVPKSTELKRPEEKQNADGESEVANPRSDECFLACINRRLFQEPESDE